jgi:hypothetical protein
MKQELYPLSPAQRYHLGLTAGGDPAPDINIAFAIFVPETNDCGRLERQLRAALNGHASLCAAFESWEGQVWQRFVGGSEVHVAVEEFDRSGPPTDIEHANPGFFKWYFERCVSEDEAACVASVIAIEKRHIFKLDQELPSRVTLLPHESGGTSVIFCFHHAALDAPSLPMLLTTIEQALDGAPPSQVDFRYFEYARKKTADYLARSGKQLDYWLDYLSDDEKVCDFSLIERSPVKCAMIEEFINLSDQKGQNSEFLNRMSQSQHLLAFEHGLGSVDSCRNNYIFTTSNNRVSSDEMDVVGCFYRHVIWRIPAYGTMEYSDFPKSIARQSLRSYQNMDVGLDDIISEFAKRRGRFPALNASLQVRDVRNIVRPADSNRLVSIVPYFLINVEDRIPVHLHVSLDDSGTAFSLTYDPTFIGAAQASSLMSAVTSRY